MSGTAVAPVWAELLASAGGIRGGGGGGARGIEWSLLRDGGQRSYMTHDELCVCGRVPGFFDSAGPFSFLIG